MSLQEITNKLGEVESVEEALKKLSLEELVYFLKHKSIDGTYLPGDECLIADILRILSQRDCSVRHSLELLDIAKEFCLVMSKLRI